jgi:hypothetical protein
MFTRKPKPQPIAWGVPSSPTAPGTDPVPFSDPAPDSDPTPPQQSQPPMVPTVDDGGRIYGGAGYIPARMGRKKALKQARRVEIDHRRRLMETRKAQIAATRDEQRQAGYLPKAGEPGPAAGRSHRRLRITPHRATSEMLAGA